MFFDTHVHFENAEGDQAPANVVRRAMEMGVDRMLAVGGSSAANKAAIETAAQFPANIHAAIGIDRDSAATLPTDRAQQPAAITHLLAELESELNRCDTKGPTIAAIGEIGLDFHYSPESAAAQIALFREQLSLAGRTGLPVIVHSREADEAMLNELRDYARNRKSAPDKIGVLHCFTGTGHFASQLLDIGFHISFSGIVTFRNADQLREVARTIPDDRLLIETDSPYLAPVPHRGKRCEPMYVRHVAEKLAEIRKTSVEELATLTSRNAERLFGF